jgi:uncharacterized protein
VVRFWDSSAVVALAAGEAGREPLAVLLAETTTVLAWWGTPVEVASAIARRERDGTFTPAQAAIAADRLQHMAARWVEIEPGEPLRRLAQRLVRVHPLRAADAFQLAAALVAAEHDPSGVEFVCLDARLTNAASREGFRVVG